MFYRKCKSLARLRLEMEMIPITGITDETMPARCQWCSAASCCVTWQPPIEEEEPIPEEPYQEFARLYPDPRNRLAYWRYVATRARARITRTREGCD